MIDPVVIQKIQRILDIGGLTHRAIARETGVSRGTVDSIAIGKRQVEGEYRPMVAHEESVAMITSPGRCVGRCSNCGAKVRAPCLACQLRALDAVRGEL